MMIAREGDFKTNHYHVFLLVVVFFFYNLTETIVLQSGLKAIFWVLIAYLYLYVQSEGKRMRTDPGWASA